MSEVTVREEMAPAERDNSNTMAIGLGALAGALVGGGLVWAYRRAMIRQAEAVGVQRPLTAIAFPDVARIALSILGLLRQVAELGR